MLNELIKTFLPIDVDALRFKGFMEQNRKQIQEGYDNVKKGKGWLAPNEFCPLCKSRDREPILTKFEISYLRCSNCTCAYAEKFPVDTSDVYNDSNYGEIAKRAYLDNVDYRKKRFGKERIELIRRFANHDIAKLKVLDVGCGTGWFLEVAKENGFEINGIEFSKQLASATSQRLGVEIYTRPLQELDGLTFDVITLFDVIEHVKNPEEIILSTYEHLNPGGIGIFFTPNLESLGIHYMKEYSTAVIPVHHPFLFSKKSLEKIFARIGFKVLLFETRGTDIIDMYAYNSEILKKPEAAQFLKENASLLQSIVDSANLGNHLRFIVQK